MRKPLDLEAPAAPERRHPLTIGSLALVLFAVLAAACGQLMLKHGMQLATARVRGSGGSLVVAAAAGRLPGGVSRDRSDDEKETIAPADPDAAGTSYRRWQIAARDSWLQAIG